MILTIMHESRKEMQCGHVILLNQCLKVPNGQGPSIALYSVGHYRHPITAFWSTVELS